MFQSYHVADLVTNLLSLTNRDALNMDESIALHAVLTEAAEELSMVVDAEKAGFYFATRDVAQTCFAV